MMYLVDTSVWIDFLRGRKVAHVAALQTLLQGEETVGTAPIILQEILQGADSDSTFDEWLEYFSDLVCYLPHDLEAAHIAAARLYHRCRRAGRTPRSSNDCVIAMTAIEHDLVLLHNDRDFELMGSADPALRLYRV
jgi:predicted nucleic acid-binding protein